MTCWHCLVSYLTGTNAPVLIIEHENRIVYFAAIDPIRQQSFLFAFFVSCKVLQTVSGAGSLEEVLPLSLSGTGVKQLLSCKAQTNQLPFLQMLIRLIIVPLSCDFLASSVFDFVMQWYNNNNNNDNNLIGSRKLWSTKPELHFN